MLTGYLERSRESERCSVAVPVNVVGDVGGRIAIIIVSTKCLHIKRNIYVLTHIYETM